MRERSGKPPGRPHDLVESLRQLLDLSQTSRNGLHLPSGLRYQILAGITAAGHAHVSGIIELAGTGNTWSAEVVLRTLLEGWIISQYVIADDTDTRAASYLVKSLNERLKFLKRIRDLAKENPQDAPRILKSAGLSSLQECNNRINERSQEISPIRHQHRLERFPSLKSCARSLGVRTEWTYASVYSLVLSAQVHVDYGVAFRFLQPPAPDAGVRTQEGVRRIMITAYMLYLDLLRMTSTHLGQPPAQSLVRFDDMLTKHLNP